VIAQRATAVAAVDLRRPDTIRANVSTKIRRHPPFNKGRRKIFGIRQKPERGQRDAALQGFIAGFNLTNS